MMDIETSNKIIQESMYDNIMTDGGITKNIVEFGYFKMGICSLIGNIQYSPCVFYFCFYSQDFKTIYDFSGKELIETTYKDYECTLVEKDMNIPYSVMFKISYEKYKQMFESKGFIKIEIPKDLKPEEKEKILYENQKLKKELDEFAKTTSKLFSEFKVNFYASVIRKNVTLLQEKKETKPIILKLNVNNNLFVVPQGDKISLAYGINFDQTTDRALARVFLQELEDTKRHLKNTVEAKYHPDPKAPPKEVSNLENDPKRYSNGFVVISKDCIILAFFIKNYNSIKDKLNYYINLRNYIQFHIHSIKTYLHIRMNKKGRELERKLNDSKIIPDEDRKEVQIMNFYSTFNKKDDEKEKKLFAQNTQTKVDV